MTVIDITVVEERISVSSGLPLICWVKRISKVIPCFLLVVFSDSTYCNAHCAILTSRLREQRSGFKRACFFVCHCSVTRLRDTEIASFHFAGKRYCGEGFFWSRA